MTTIKFKKLSRLETLILATRMQSLHITKPIRSTLVTPILDTNFAMGNIVLSQRNVQQIAALETTAPLTILAQMILHLHSDSRAFFFYFCSVSSVLALNQPEKDEDRKTI